MLRVYQACQTGLIPYETLPCGTQLCTAITCFNSAAAYVVSRKGAEILLSKTKTIRVPLDVRYWQGWFGLRESTLFPLGETLSEFSSRSTISPTRRRLTPWVHPLWWTVRLFRVLNRVRRYTFQFFRAFRRFLKLK